MSAATLIAFDNPNRHVEIDQAGLQQRQRQHVLRVDIVRVVAWMGPDVELKERSAPRVALRAEIHFFEQVKALASGPPVMSNQSPPVAPLDRLVEIPRFYAVRGADLLNLFVGPERDALADKEFSPGWLGSRYPLPRAKRKSIALVGQFIPMEGLDHLRRRRQQGLASPVNEGVGILCERRRQHGTGTD